MLALLRTAVVVACGAALAAGAVPATAGKKHPAEAKGLKSAGADFETSIKFVNKSGQTVKLFWIDYDGERKEYETIKDGDTYTMEKTFLTHPWLITDGDENAWYVYFPDAQPRTVEVVAPAQK